MQYSKSAQRFEIYIDYFPDFLYNKLYLYLFERNFEMLKERDTDKEIVTPKEDEKKLEADRKDAQKQLESDIKEAEAKGLVVPEVVEE